LIRPMNTLLNQIAVSLRINFRNRIAIIYGYLFPVIFLFAFWAIYRSDKVPLSLHMGQLLTVTILGGACFGLPTTMVAERERGVWRRYRLTPIPVWSFVTSTLITRYVLLLTAAVLQIALAMVIGMPAPRHLPGLLLAFTFASIAFLGLGLEIAMLADSVPAVQALGQCIFLPMLMIGGVAVQLSSLPRWALHLAAFLPGRYAVETLQACVTGDGLRLSNFGLLALLLIGAAGSIAAIRTFRWDPKQRVAKPGDKLWLGFALCLWLTAGLLAEAHGRIMMTSTTVEGPPVEDYVAVAPRSSSVAPQAAPVRPATTDTHAPARSASVATVADSALHQPSSWHDVSEEDIKGVAFERLPPDEGIISPIAHSGEVPDPVVSSQLEQIRSKLLDWPPDKVSDPVQRVRNDLYVAAVPDVLQMEQVERFVPLLVFERLRLDISAAELPKILYWVATHPDEGDDSAVSQLDALGLPAVSGPTKTVRGRVMLYSFKLLGRLDKDAER
jgi:ABC-2 type transporter